MLWCDLTHTQLNLLFPFLAVLYETRLVMFGICRLCSMHAAFAVVALSRGEPETLARLIHSALPSCFDSLCCHISLLVAFTAKRLTRRRQLSVALSRTQYYFTVLLPAQAAWHAGACAEILELELRLAMPL